MAGFRRMDRRVIARTKARARAARPATWASAIGAPSGSADVFATGRLTGFRPAVAVGVGARVGNRPAAFAVAGFSVAGFPMGPSGGMLGRLPTGSGEVIVTGFGGGAAGATG